MRTCAVLLAIALLIWVCAVCCAADDTRLDWHSVNCGGGVATGGGYAVACTVGQSAAGFVQSKSSLHWIGFWAGEAPTPTVASTLGAAKLLPDGTLVSVCGKIAASAADDFAGFFYIEEPNRTGGIRVSCSSWPVADLFRGSTVNVIGTLATASSGERHITGSVIVVGATVDPPTPFGLSNRSVGGASFGQPGCGQSGAIGGVGLNNIGILIKTWGLIKSCDAGYLVIDDGSGVDLHVDATGLANPPSSGYITVVGISSLRDGRLPVVLPRSDDDVN